MKVFFKRIIFLFLSFLSCFNSLTGQISEDSAFSSFTSIMESAKVVITSATDEESYNAVKEMLYAHLDSLGAQYPTFEPNERQIEIASQLFDSFIEVDDSIRFELNISADDEDDDELFNSLLKTYAAQASDSIYTEFALIKDCGDRILAILERQNSKFNEATSLVELQYENAVMEALLTKMIEDCDNYAPDSVTENKLLSATHASLESGHPVKYSAKEGKMKLFATRLSNGMTLCIIAPLSEINASRLMLVVVAMLISAFLSVITVLITYFFIIRVSFY